MQQTLLSTTFIFSWATGLNLLLAWFIDVNIHNHRKYNMADETLTKMDRNRRSENVAQKSSIPIYKMWVFAGPD